MTSNFVDYVKILVRSGKGGAGSAHLLRVKYNAKAGPDGGDGGRGGHVILRGNSQRWTLIHLKYTKHVFAENGQNGGENLRTGRMGADIPDWLSKYIAILKKKIDDKGGETT